MTLEPLAPLHLLDHSRPVDDGYAFRSHAIIRAQQDRGWTPLALTSPKHFESWTGQPTVADDIDGVRYHHAPPVRASRWPFVAEGRGMRVMAARLRALIDTRRPHVLHAHSPVLNALPAVQVGRERKIPVVYEVRASWEDAAVSTGKFGPGSWKYRLTRAIETLSCRWAGHVVVICDGLKAELISRGIPAANITVIPNGVNLESFTPAEPDDEIVSRWGLQGKRVVAFIGSFFHWEGLELLVEAAAILRQTRDDIRVLLVGGGDRADALAAQVSALGLHDTVLLPGRVPPARVQELYAVAHVMAYPRHSIRLTELVTPLKPLEAMAMRKAVVASDVGGHRELIADGVTGLLFKAGDAHALAAALVRVVDDDSLRRRLEDAGREFVVRERSWQRTTKDYDQVYASLVGPALIGTTPATTVER